jgi:hypothetical protein
MIKNDWFWRGVTAFSIIATMVVIYVVLGMKPYEGGILNDLDSFQAGRYAGLIRDGLPASLFSALPDAADDINVMKSMITIGKVSMENFCTKLGPEYYKQYTFYPNSNTFLDMYKNPPRDVDGTLRRGVYGYGSYISEINAGVKPGDDFSACVIIFSAPYISTFQSLALRADAYGGNGTTIVFKNNHFSDGGLAVGDTDMDRYFTMTIEPGNLLLEPSYPYFFADWAQKIRLDVRVSPDTPPGKYMIVVSPNGILPEELNNEWSWEHKTNYVGASGFRQDILMVGVEIA